MNKKLMFERLNIEEWRMKNEEWRMKSKESWRE